MHLRRRLGWEAATERCLDVASIGEDEWPNRLSAAQEALLWGTYNTFTGALHALCLHVDARMLHPLLKRLL